MKCFTQNAKAAMPMLTSIVTGTLWSTDMLLACAEEDGLLNLEPSKLPPGCPPLEPPPQELIVVLYEALLGSRRVRESSNALRMDKRDHNTDRAGGARRFLCHCRGPLLVHS